jgi:hypothetical protein
MARARQIFAIARLTASETARRPLCALLALACVALTALGPALRIPCLGGAANRLARDTGLALHFVLGLALAGYAGCAAPGPRRARSPAPLLFSKPVGRAAHFFGVFLGVAAVAVWFSLCATLATALAERAAERGADAPAAEAGPDGLAAGLLLLAPLAACAVGGAASYRSRRPFAAAAFTALAPCLGAAVAVTACFTRDGRWAWAAASLGADPAVYPASALLLAALLQMAALSMGLSACMKPAAAFAVCAAAALGGLFVESWRVAQPASPAAAFAHAVLPNWQQLWSGERLLSGVGFSAGHAGLAVAAAAVYAAAWLCVGAGAWEDAEIA